MVGLDQICLYSFLFILFYIITTQKQERITASYWQNLIVIIISYSIILGCRYGWGHDYMDYKWRIEHPFIDDDDNFGFNFINSCLGYLGCNYVMIYIFYSLCYIIGVLSLIKTYNNNKFMIMIMFPSTLQMETFAIRQSLATSFIYIALAFMMYPHLKNKKKWALISLNLIIAASIHKGALILAIPFIICYYLHLNKAIPLKYGLTSYLIIIIFQSVFRNNINNFLEVVVPILSFDDHFQNYVEKSDIWFGADAEKEDVYSFNATFEFLMHIAYIAFIILGYWALKIKENKNIAICYNICIVAIIIRYPVFTQEILRRLIDPFVIMQFIPMGYAMAIMFSYKHGSEQIYTKSKILKGVLYTFLFYIYYPMIGFLFLSKEKIFVWNI